MHRKHSKGVVGESHNATLSAARFNSRKQLSFFSTRLLGGVFALRLATFRSIGTKSAFASP